MTFLRHISHFDVNTGLLSIGREPAFTDTALDYALELDSYSSKRLVPYAVEIGRILATHFQNTKENYVEMCSLYIRRTTGIRKSQAKLHKIMRLV